MTFLETKSESDTKNIILECSSKIMFDQVSENLKKVIGSVNKSYFKREYMFLSTDAFYEYKGKLEKEKHTEQYFMILFKNKEEFSELINNPHINISEINKKDIFFIFVIPNTFRRISESERYYLFNHVYLDVKEKVKWTKEDVEEIPQIELLSKSGFRELSEINQVDILENIILSKEELDALQFSGTLSEDVTAYYFKNFYKKQGNGSFSKFRNKLMTIF